VFEAIERLQSTAVSWNLAWGGPNPTHRSPGPLTDGETVVKFAPSDELPTVHTQIKAKSNTKQGWNWREGFEPVVTKYRAEFG
jgi:hypothetical protein